MDITVPQLVIINIALHIDSEGKGKQYPLSDLTTASDILKEIKKCVEDDNFITGKVDFTSIQKVFIVKLIDERNWTVNDAETVFELKELLK